MRRKHQLSTPGLRPNEEVVFFPTLARRNGSGGWDVEIRGQLFEPKRESAKRRLLMGLLRRSLKISKRGESNSYFQRRARLFLVTNTSRELKIELNGQAYALAPSGRSGLIRETLPVASTLPTGWQDYRLPPAPGDPRVFSGRVLVLEPRTIVVSDVDDTIKVTEARQRRMMMSNTFLRSYRAVPGMANLYQQWAKTINKVAFCYVSASPWPLLTELRGFMEEQGFPEGEVELKRFQWRARRVLNLFQSPKRFKTPLLESLFQRFPKASFVLVGDSGERDPEIYAAAARRHAGRVRKILIRHLPATEAERRYRRAFNGLPQDRWRVFRDAQELKGSSL